MKDNTRQFGTPLLFGNKYFIVRNFCGRNFREIKFHENQGIFQPRIRFREIVKMPYTKWKKGSLIEINVF